MTYLEELRQRRAAAAAQLSAIDEAIAAIERLEVSIVAPVAARPTAGVTVAGGDVVISSVRRRGSDPSKRPMAARAEMAVRRALVEGHNRPKAIREASGLAKWQVDDALRSMEEAGAIQGSGTTRSRVYRLL